MVKKSHGRSPHGPTRRNPATEPPPESSRFRIAAACAASIALVVAVLPAAAQKPGEGEKGKQIGPAQPAAPAPPGRLQIVVPVGKGNGRGNAVAQIRVQVQAGPGGAATAESGALDERADSVFRDPPRELQQRFKRSETLIQEKRFAEAVEMLGGVLEEPEDYSYQIEGSATRGSLKTEAQRRIGTLPAEGREAYELQYGARARRMLDAAVMQGDEQGLAEVARRYFHTVAGYQAAYLLGLQHLDHQRPLAAALCLRRLREVASVADQWEPELSFKLATAWARAGSPDTAAAVLDDAKRRFPGAEFAVAGALHRWYGSGEAPQDWLRSRTVGRNHAAAADVRRPVQWAVYRGDAARNAIGPGGSPLLNRRWAVPFVNHPEVEKLVEQLRRNYVEQEQIVLPAVHPLAVDDVVLTRTLTGLTAVDFRTGKRIWRGAGDETLEQLLERDAPFAGRNNEAGALGGMIDSLVWHDATLGTLSSDGRRAYCVEETPRNQFEFSVQRTVILANGRRIGPGGTRPTNRLAAYDLATEGKLVWEIGGPAGASDALLAEMQFLGPPLPLGDRLYVLGETKGEIRLVVLNSATGKPDWTQQLAVTSEADVGISGARAGLSPSYADGVLVCPTTLGAAVAVDLNDRSLLWGFQYRERADSDRRNAVFNWQLNGRIESAVDADRWQDSTIALSDGKVVLAPPESNYLYCLRLVDGQLLWKQPRARGLYVACIAAKKVVVLAADEMRAYDLESGKPAWTAALPEGGKPSGRGFYNGKNYYLPLSSAEVAALDVDSGRFTARSRSRSGSVPGNLICYRGAVISQGPAGLECFYQVDDLRKDVLARLERNPDDAAALASRGELLLDEGKIAEAVESLRKSYRGTTDPRTKNLLIDALLELLKADASEADVADLEALVRNTDREEYFLRLRGEALVAAGNRRAAFTTFLRLVDLTALPDEPIRASGDVSIRRERWVKTRLAELMAGGDASDVEEMRREVRRRRDEAAAADDPVVLRRFLRYFGDHADADPVRLKLAVRLTDAHELLEAESLLRAVALRGEEPHVREAVARLAKLLVADAARPEEAAVYLRRLAGDFADQSCLDGKTGKQIVAALSPGGEFEEPGPRHIWPVGRVEVAEVRFQNALNIRSPPLEFRGERGPYFGGVTIEMDQPKQEIVCRDELGIDRWRVSLADGDRRNVNHFNQLISHVRADGHLLVVSLGSELAVVDTLGSGGRNSPRVLWRRQLTDTMPGLNPLQGINQRVVQLPWGMPRFMAFDQLGRPIGATGPATLRYVSYLKQRTLCVVEPLTGETIWIRHGVDPGSEVFGDEEYLFVTAPDQGKTLVLSAADGRELKQVEIAPADERVISYGRRLLTWKTVAGRTRLALVDALEEKELWRHEFAANAKLWPIAEDEVAVVDRAGNFAVVTTADGTRRLDARVQPEPNLSEAFVERTPQSYLLLTSSPFRQREGVNVQPALGHFGNSLVNGYLYGFDRTTKKQLFRTKIAGHGLTLNQPKGLPMLVFASQIYEHPRNGQVRGPQAVLLCIDKRNGRVLIDKRLTTPLNALDVSAEPEKNVVVLKTFRDAFRFTFTDEAWPADVAEPKPSDLGADANEGKLSTQVGKSIVGSAEQIGRAVRDARRELDQAREAEAKKSAAGGKPPSKPGAPVEKKE